MVQTNHFNFIVSNHACNLGQIVPGEKQKRDKDKPKPHQTEGALLKQNCLH